MNERDLHLMQRRQELRAGRVMASLLLIALFFGLGLLELSGAFR